MTVAFGLLGQPMLALMVLCDMQDGIDHCWNALPQGADPAAQQCGWLDDHFGMPWQLYLTQ